MKYYRYRQLYIIKKNISLFVLLFFLLAVCAVIGVSVHKPQLLVTISKDILQKKLPKQHLKIIIKGNKRLNTIAIEGVIKDFVGNKNILDVSLPALKDHLKQQIPWIKTATINRNIPNILYLVIEEYQPFAIWFNGIEKFVIDKDGNTIIAVKNSENPQEFDNMFIVSGNGANINVKSFFNIVAINPDFSNLIYSAHWVGGRRWDIRLSDGTLIKMPENNIYQAWQDLLKIIKNKQNIKSIDLRIENRIYIEKQKTANTTSNL